MAVSLNDMDIYQLYDIFEHLNTNDLLNLYDTNSNLREAVSTWVERKMPNTAYKIQARDLDPVYYTQEKVDTLLRYFRCFGDLITNIEYNQEDGEYDDTEVAIFGRLYNILTTKFVNLKTLFLRFVDRSFDELQPFHTRFVRMIVGSRKLLAIGFYCSFEGTVLHPFWHGVRLRLLREKRSITIIIVFGLCSPEYRQLLHNFIATQTVIKLEYVMKTTQLRRRMFQINNFR